jgi:hypothetical protein
LTCEESNLVPKIFNKFSGIFHRKRPLVISIFRKLFFVTEPGDHSYHKRLSIGLVLDQLYSYIHHIRLFKLADILVHILNKLSSCGQIVTATLHSCHLTTVTIINALVRFEVFTAVTMKNAVFLNVKTQLVPHRRHITSMLQSSGG